MSTEGCHIEHASDGTPVRVQGSIDPDLLDLLTAQVRDYVDSRCHDVGPHLMPEMAQRIHGRATYWCDKERGHEGAHKWADLEWDQP